MPLQRGRNYITNPSQEPQRAHEQAGWWLYTVIRSTKRNKYIYVAGMVEHNPKTFYAYGNERRVVRDSIGPVRTRTGALRSSDTTCRIYSSNISLTYSPIRIWTISQKYNSMKTTNITNISFSVNLVQEQLNKHNHLQIYRTGWSAPMNIYETLQNH